MKKKKERLPIFILSRLRDQEEEDKIVDIAAMSMNLSSTRLQNEVGLAMTKKAMDQQEIEAANLIKMMDSAAVPPSDHIIDLKV